MRDGDSLSQDQSIFPRNFAGPGEPVMRIGLNDPKNKSIVLSTAEFSADELGESTKNLSPTKSKKKRKTRRNAKFS